MFTELIVSHLRSDHRDAIDQSQSNYIKCQSLLSDEKQIYEIELSKVKRVADRNERTFQSKVKQYLKETNIAYKRASEGIEKASKRIQLENESKEPIKLQLAQSDKRLQAIRNTLTEASKKLELSNIAHNESKQELIRVQNELDIVEEELDKRDMERIECDQHHRDLLDCRKRYADLAKVPADYQRIIEMNGGLVEKNIEKDEEISECYMKLEKRIRDCGDGDDDIDIEYTTKMKETESKLEVALQEKAFWESKATMIIDKVSFRSKKEVLERFGSGPYFVKFVLSIEGYSDNESFLLELANLDSMPHTIHTFLELIDKKMLTRGTLILAREHILVGGPVDAHDEVNNQQLEDLMLYEGYFPDGALLFSEYSEEHPHVQMTFGFNHLGGPIFYFNLHDNTELHGPKQTDEGYKEGDPCFGTVVEGLDVIQRIIAMPKTEDDSIETQVYIMDTQVVNVSA